MVKNTAKKGKDTGKDLSEPVRASSSLAEDAVELGKDVVRAGVEVGPSAEHGTKKGIGAGVETKDGVIREGIAPFKMAMEGPKREMRKPAG